ncbi:MAG: response regulator [Gammaproteobacteria bacterium]|nr:response regulator [Gammaproteobacteria bacterium]
MRILLIEDDALFGSGVKSWLGLKGYSIDWVKNGQLAEQALALQTYRLVLLDLQLPHFSGMDILHKLRARNDNTPTIILTARDNLHDRLAGLDGGADDYLVKPFDLEELGARVRALVRRSNGHASMLIEHKHVTLNPATGKVTQSGNIIDIPPREFAVLQTLMENKGKPVSRYKLETGLYSWDNEIESNAVVVHIHNLRKKLGSGFIQTKRGFGYIVGKT